jgi:hypothetical protein
MASNGPCEFGANGNMVPLPQHILRCSRERPVRVTRKRWYGGQLRRHLSQRASWSLAWQMHVRRWCWLVALLGCVTVWLDVTCDRVLGEPPEWPRVLLLSPTPAEDSARWADLVRALLSVGTRAVQVADLPIDPVFAACRRSECAARAAQAAQLPAALFVSVPAAAGSAAALELQLFASDGRAARTRRSLAGQSWIRTATALFESARQRLALGDGALLRVQSTPESALVSVDGQPAGVTPFEQPVVAGSHVLRVGLDGFSSQQRTLHVDRGQIGSVSIRLERAPLSSDLGPRRDHVVAAPSNFVLGSVLVLVALPALIAGTNALANDGQCLEAVGDTCRQRAHFGTGAALLLAGGALSLLGSGFFFIAQPFQLSADVSHTALELRLRTVL